MPWDDEAEVAAAREKKRQSDRINLQIVGAALFAVFAVCVTIKTCLHHESAARVSQLAAVAASVSAQQARWNAEHPIVDASTTVDVPDVLDVPEGADFDEPGRALLVKLVANPRAIAVREVTAPDEDHPWTSYEYEAPALGGELLQNRWDARRWEIVVEHGHRPEVFARAGALKALDDVRGVVQWWRITAGDFKGDFVQVRPTGMSLFSQPQICGHRPSPYSMTPRVDHECGY